jgi:uncharacterized protein YbcV (DUF1398 family)
MNTRTIGECMKLSFANTHFPEVVKKLAGAGVCSYTADLVSLAKTYYGADREVHSEVMPLSGVPSIAEAFDGAAISTAIRSIQQRQLGYADFLRQIMEAGCSQYQVFIGGRKAIYFGRNGDFHIEAFPPARQ